MEINKSRPGELNISLMIAKKYFQMSYNLNSKIRVHSFNGINLIKRKDYLKIMIEKVIKNKVNFNLNKELSLFANSAINLKK